MPLSVTRPFLTPSNDASTTTAFSALCAISHALEDVVMQGIPDAQVAVGFQRLSSFRRQEQRYRAMAMACRQVWVCAVPDEEPPVIDGLIYAPVCAEWPVADEWFIVVNAPGFTSALLATEFVSGLSGQDRSFQTMFTSDARLVNAICRSLMIELGLRIEIPTTRDTEAQQINLRRFNKLALEYQQQRAPHSDKPIVNAPIWSPTLGRARYFGEPLASSTDR
jgi:DICT domain-containing protein